MAWTRPTLLELANRTAASFRADMPGSDAKLWPNNVAISAKVMAGAVWESFGFLDYIARQSFAHLAEGIWLERKCRDYGIARKAAVLAEGDVTIDGTTGTTVPAGLAMTRADGVEYVSISGGTLRSPGTLDVRVRALVAGSAGNAATGVVMTLLIPPSGVESAAEVAASGIGGGADVETDASLRERLLFRLQNPPHGGAAHDYIAWMREVAGVTRAYVDPVTATNGRTTVGCWPMFDGTRTNGIPTAADLAAVRTFLDTVRPAGAVVEVLAATPVSIAITIDDLEPDTVTVRNAIDAELRDLFSREMRVSTLTRPFTFRVSHIWEAVSAAAGERSHRITVPEADVVVPYGSIPVLGAVTYT